MNEQKQTGQQNAKLMAVRLVALAVGMFAFGVFALPPLYDVFCEVTGLGGKTDQTAAVGVEVAPDATREIDLEFVTTVNQYAPYSFRAELDGMTIHPGGLYEAHFVAENLSDRARIAQAVPSVAPAQAAEHFKKLECFCFNEQTFGPGEVKVMPVRFIIDSDLPYYIDTITLSYTFFDTTAPEAEVPGHAGHKGR